MSSVWVAVGFRALSFLVRVVLEVQTRQPWSGKEPIHQIGEINRRTQSQGASYGDPRSGCNLPFGLASIDEATRVLV